jgi:hypothetical protein
MRKRSKTQIKPENALLIAFVIFVLLVLASWPTLAIKFSTEYPLYETSEGSTLEVLVHLRDINVKEKSYVISVDQIGLDNRNVEDSIKNKFCEDGLWLMDFELGGGGLGFRPLARGDDISNPICQGNDPYRKTITEDRDTTRNFTHHRLDYPYDEITIDVGLLIGGYRPNHDIGFSAENEGTVAPIVHWDLDFEGWTVEDVIHSNDGNISRIRFTLQRPLVYRILSPLIIFCALIFIFSILLLPDLASLAQTASGILFGLFGIRQIIIAPDVDWFTTLDAIILCLYILLFIFATVKIFTIYRKDKKQET